VHDKAGDISGAEEALGGNEQDVLMCNYRFSGKVKRSVIYVVSYEKFEVFTAVAMKNSVFWDVTPCGCCKNRCFKGI
jgi:hypothetical protein